MLFFLFFFYEQQNLNLNTIFHDFHLQCYENCKCHEHCHERVTTALHNYITSNLILHRFILCCDYDVMCGPAWSGFVCVFIIHCCFCTNKMFLFNVFFFISFTWLNCLLKTKMKWTGNISLKVHFVILTCVYSSIDTKQASKVSVDSDVALKVYTIHYNNILLYRPLC